MSSIQIASESVRKLRLKFDQLFFIVPIPLVDGSTSSVMPGTAFTGLYSLWVVKLSYYEPKGNMN